MKFSKDRVLAAHLAVALTAGPLFVLLGLSGIVNLFGYQLDAKLNPALFSGRAYSEPPANPASLQRVFDQASSQGGVIEHIRFPTKTQPVYITWLDDEYGSRLYQDSKGDIQGKRPPDDSFRWKMYHLHSQFLLGGEWAEKVVTVVGFILILQLALGAWLFWTRRKALLKAGWSDPRKLHAVFGLSVALFLVIKVLTATVLVNRAPKEWIRALAGEGMHNLPEVESPEDAKRLPLDELFAVAQKAMPGKTAKGVDFWSESGRPVSFLFSSEHEDYAEGRDIVHMDPFTGQVVRVDIGMGPDAPRGTHWINVIYGMHTGMGGPLPARLLHLILGLAPLGLLLGGLVLYRRRAA